MAFEITRTGAFARIHVATLVDGMLPIPSNLSVAVEIGMSDGGTLATEVADQGSNTRPCQEKHSTRP